MPEVIRIIGIGNPLMGDDGVGIAAVERLAGMEFPTGVEVLDGGTGGLTLLELMEGADRVILVDAVEMARAPGTVEIFDLNDIDLEDADATDMSLHQTGLVQVLALGRELGAMPQVTLVGVQPASVERGLGLSVPVGESIPSLIDLILERLSTF